MWASATTQYARPPGPGHPRSGPGFGDPGGQPTACSRLDEVVLSGSPGDEWMLLTVGGVQLSLLVVRSGEPSPNTGPRWVAGTAERLDFLAGRLRARSIPVTGVPDRTGRPGLLLSTAAEEVLITELQPGRVRR